MKLNSIGMARVMTPTNNQSYTFPCVHCVCVSVSQQQNLVGSAVRVITDFLRFLKRCVKFMQIKGILRYLSPCLSIRGYRRMAGRDSFAPPEHVKGMRVLDRDSFTKTLTVPCLTIPADQNLNKVMPVIKSKLLKLKNLKPVRETQEGQKILFLNPEEVSGWSDLPADKLSEFSVDESALGKENVQMTYENYQMKDVLKGILPEDLEGISSFSQVGHIVHVNLRDETLPYKEVVGQVLLDKIPNCKSVVNKLNTIDNTYRNFQLELLAGEENYKTLVKENGVSFEFDFSKVYWNSRLSTEHERIVQSVKPKDVVYDVFAGVGPFAVPIAKKTKCRVLANDLNPDSAKWLEHNKKLNKIGDNLRVFNKDAKDFILEDVKEDLLKELTIGHPRTLRVVMNLPEMGKEFLKYFVGLVQDQEVLSKWNPSEVPLLINVYCFVRSEDLKAAAQISVEEQIQCKLSPEDIQSISFVRNVAPNKDMMRVSFFVTKELLGGKKVPEKRKLDEEELIGEEGESVVKKPLCG